MNHHEFLDKAETGDIYRVTRYMIGRLYTPVRDEETEGQEAIVLRNIKNPRGVDCVVLRLLVSGREIGYSWRDREYEAFELVRKGDGTAVAGVHYAFTEDELRHQRYDAFIAKVAAHDFRHQGFSNAATFLAHLYLANDRTFDRRVPTLRRKDGTINADKVRKAFFDLGLVVDAWALECPIDVPAEFARHRIPGLPTVNWEEVAAQFAAETANT